jgi:ubiquinone/menaquinone biosynthesis C-methylase UbiE
MANNNSKQANGARSYYDLLASKYDDATKEYKWIAPETVSNLLLPHVKPGNSVLDVGIGTAQSTEAFLKAGGNVCGVDISSKMLDKAREKYPSLELYQGNIEDGVPFLSTRSFDIVLGVGILEFVTNIEKVIGILSQLTKYEVLICLTFEEFIAKHEVQGMKVSVTAKGVLENVPQINNFMTARYEYKEIESLIQNAGLSLLEHQHFMAYEKSKERIPIYYTIMLARKLV